ncbi:MAG: hypothetical protein HYS98_05900 [Deltaproteobacteria bacterium]|nr:hypothetical protein [Deltaproteobacteria bacterium]
MEYIYSLDKTILFQLFSCRFILLSLWVGLLYLVLKKDSSFVLLVATILVGSVSIVFDMGLLNSGYALWPDGSGDRFPYIALAKTLAVGNPFGEDALYKNVPTMLSPLYAYVIGQIHRLTNCNLFRLYDFSSLLWTFFLPLSFYFFYTKTSLDKNDKNFKWEAILMAFFALYLSSDIQDLRFFREDFWNLLVLFKPSHSLSFICIPILYYTLSKSLSVTNVLMGSIVLSLMLVSWFVTGVFVVGGLVFYLLFLLWLKRKDFVKTSVQVIGITLGGGVLSAWYWVPFFIFKDLHSQTGTTILNYTKYDNVLFDPFESTFFMVPLFWLGGVGLWMLARRRNRWDLLVLGMIASLYGGKFIVYPLTRSVFGFGPQAFECSVFFIRFMMGVAAGSGIYALVQYFKGSFRFSFSRLKFLNFQKQSTWVVMILLALTPYFVIFWQVPVLNSKWYIGLSEISPHQQKLGNWIEHNTKPDSVILTDGQTALWLAAMTGRKLLIDAKGIYNFNIDFSQRKKFVQEILEAQFFSVSLQQKMHEYQLTHIIITHQLKKQFPGLYLDKLLEPAVKKVYELDDCIVFALNG